MTVGVLGLGKLGLPFALTLQRCGNPVIAWDVDPAVRDAVSAGTPTHVDEPDMGGRPLVLVEPARMLEHASIIFIVVPTPFSRPPGASHDLTFGTDCRDFRPCRTAAARPTLLEEVIVHDLAQRI